MRLPGLLALPLVLFESVGCATTCTLDFHEGLFIRIKNSPPGDCKAEIVIQDGAYTEPLGDGSRASDGKCVYVGAIERPGTYVVTLKAAGFEPIRKTVRVPPGDCHVDTQEIEFTLVPSETPGGGVSNGQ